MTWLAALLATLHRACALIFAWLHADLDLDWGDPEVLVQ